uniref:Uncharacterized protein n=1 Tax=Rhizophora mucronata TaxID=61149 RepID=A0A2P2PQ91_RHIMU
MPLEKSSNRRFSSFNSSQISRREQKGGTVIGFLVLGKNAFSPCPNSYVIHCWVVTFVIVQSSGKLRSLL